MKKKKNYVNNERLLEELKEYKAKCREAEDQGELPPQISNYIGECILKIAEKLSYKPNFSNYMFREEMVSDGIENGVKAVKTFDPEKSSNPFSYFTTVIYYAFLRRIHSEKKQLYIRHKVLENSVISGTIVDTPDGEHGEATYVDMHTGYMNEFVSDYENKMNLDKSKKKKEKEKEKGLIKFASNT